MAEYSDAALAVLCLIVVVVSLWIVHKVNPRVPH